MPRSRAGLDAESSSHRPRVRVRDRVMNLRVRVQDRVRHVRVRVRVRVRHMYYILIRNKYLIQNICRDLHVLTKESVK